MVQDLKPVERVTYYRNFHTAALSVGVRLTPDGRYKGHVSLKTYNEETGYCESVTVLVRQSRGAEYYFDALKWAERMRNVARWHYLAHGHYVHIEQGE
jgi:hypothetical protein